MKLTKHALTLWAIALVAVLVLTFVIPFAHTAVFWAALACTVAMFGLCAFAFVRAFRLDGTVQSKLLGWPVFKVGYTALIVQIIVGFALMSTAAVCPVWVVVVAEMLVFATAGVCLTVKEASRKVVTQSEAKAAGNTAAWKAIRAKANALAASTGNAELRKLAEEIRYADPTPTSMDGEFAQMLETLSGHADAANIQKALGMMEQRKALSKGEK